MSSNQGHPPPRFKRRNIFTGAIPSMAELAVRAAPKIDAEESRLLAAMQTATPDDVVLIDEIVKRGVAIWELGGVLLNPRVAMMDILACHTNNIPLDLHKFLRAEQADFMEEFKGIGEHMNRGTGRLVLDYKPRFRKVRQ